MFVEIEKCANGFIISYESHKEDVAESTYVKEVFVANTPAKMMKKIKELLGSGEKKPRKKKVVQPAEATITIGE
jgi:hypothetical protein